MSASRDPAVARYEAKGLDHERRVASARPRQATDPRLRAAPPSRHRASRLLRARRIVVLCALLLLADVLISFVSAMAQPSNVGFGVRSVEWLRDNGAAWLVSDVESIYYTFNAPSTGGPALKALPKVGVAGAALAAAYRPPAIAPVISPALPGEGVWHGTGPLVRGTAPVLVATYRPDPSFPQMVAGVAWIDSSRAWLQLYPGRYEPPNSGNAAAEVPPQLRSELLATFNSGFKLEDDGAGFVAFGHVYAPLRDGQATLLRYRDGTVNLINWTGGPNPGPTVEFARQNLPLIASRGQLNPTIGDGSQWGATLGNAVRVWRSGVGIDAHGNVLYAAANDQTAASLAELLQHAGAVREMELDINSEWVTFNFFGSLGAGNARKLLPDMTRDPARYLSPDDRDFLAVYVRHG